MNQPSTETERQECVKRLLDQEACIIITKRCQRCWYYHACREDEHADTVRQLDEMDR